MRFRIYQLSNTGRALTFSQWLKLGGCGIPHDSCAPSTLGPISQWGRGKITLSQIEDACAYTGRSLARFAIERLGRPELAKDYVSPHIGD